MKLLIFISCFAFVSSQSVVDDKLKPFVKLARLSLTQLWLPKNFETGYRIGLKNDVRRRIKKF